MHWNWPSVRKSERARPRALWGRALLLGEPLQGFDQLCARISVVSALIALGECGHSDAVASRLLRANRRRALTGGGPWPLARVTPTFAYGAGCHYRSCHDWDSLGGEYGQQFTAERRLHEFFRPDEVVAPLRGQRLVVKLDKQAA